MNAPMSRRQRRRERDRVASAALDMVAHRRAKIDARNRAREQRAPVFAIYTSDELEKVAALLRRETTEVNRRELRMIEGELHRRRHAAIRLLQEIPE